MKYFPKLIVAFFILILVFQAPSLQADSSARVEIFITSWCPYCQLLEKFLIGNKIPYTKYDIEKNPLGKRLHAELGGGGVPVSRVDGSTVIRGFNPMAILEGLKKKDSKLGSSQI